MNYIGSVQTILSKNSKLWFWQIFKIIHALQFSIQKNNQFLYLYIYIHIFMNYYKYSFPYQFLWLYTSICGKLLPLNSFFLLLHNTYWQWRNMYFAIIIWLHFNGVWGWLKHRTSIMASFWAIYVTVKSIQLKKLSITRKW